MQNYIIESEKKTPILSECEVLIAGGGIAGIAAAIAAARNGKKVTLLEREFTLGGMATLGLITIYLPLCDGEGHQIIYGIGEELLMLSIKDGAEARYPTAWLDGDDINERRKNRFLVQFNPHLFALRAEELLVSLGVTILYGTLACAVECKDEKITSVIVENKSGRSAILVESVIDCSGDADICKLAGVKTALHEGGNGLASWYYYSTQGEVKLKMFGLADVIPEKDSEADEYDNVQQETLDENVRFSGVDAFELSDVVIKAHEIMFEDIMKEHSLSDDYVPVTISTIPLVRMSRRLVGEYTMDDTESHKYIEDSVGTFGDWRKRGPVYELPFRTLYNADMKNLLVAGRDISVTDAMWDITRVIPVCAVTGEAAGTAASMCDDFTAIDISKLQEKLTAQNVKIHLD